MNTVIQYQTGREVSEAIRDKSPGVLQHNISLVIGTHVVKSLLIGENRGPIGLFRFAKSVKAMTEAAEGGDSKAAEELRKIDNMISKVRKSIRIMLQQTRAAIPETTGVIIDTPSAQHPLIIRLQFNTEYAYLAAFMLAECDQLIHMLLRQVEVGFSPRHELGEQLSIIRRQIRSVLSLPIQWQSTN